MKDAVELGLHTLRNKGYTTCKPEYDVFSWNSVDWAVDGLLFNYLFELQFSQCCLLNTLAGQNVSANFKGHKLPWKRCFPKGTGLQNALDCGCLELN